MKVHSKDARVGRFLIVKQMPKMGSISASSQVVASQDGFDTYDDAEAQVSTLPGKSQNERYLILQVVGEFKTALQLVEVHAAS